jgi:hypothetical protein
MQHSTTFTMLILIFFLALAEAGGSPAASSAAVNAGSCQCLQAGVWCGSRTGSGTWNATFDGDHQNGTHFNGTDLDGGHFNGTHDDGGHHNGTHFNGTHYDGGHQNLTHYNETRYEYQNKTQIRGPMLSGACEGNTLYDCPLPSAAVNNSFPCSKYEKTDSKKLCAMFVGGSMDHCV